VQTYLNNADVMNSVVESGRKKMVSRSALELGSLPTRSYSRIKPTVNVQNDILPSRSRRSMRAITPNLEIISEINVVNYENR
jgi:enterochelin esterase-like enzyme